MPDPDPGSGRGSDPGAGAGPGASRRPGSRSRLAPVREDVWLATTPDGVELFLREWTPTVEVERGAILLVHGLGEHSGRYRRLAEFLTEAGYRVRAYDHAGFGRSGGQRGHIRRPLALLDDLSTVFEDFDAAVRLDDPGAPPPLILGHSMGGCIVARALSGGVVHPTAAVLASPAVGQRAAGVQNAALRLAEFLPDRLTVPNGLPKSALSHDPATAAAMREDPFCHDRISAALAHFVFDEGERAVADAGRVPCPVLLLIAGGDRVIDPAGERRLAAALPTATTRVEEFPEAYHELFNEAEPTRAFALDALRGWLEGLK
ncbi:lysophospholipase [Catenulispora sp. NL8]|uniref:Lysophospholipase n=1 Tax=Catenulispora pinistramenti TaxID=2705254 RepID=A0ABS5KZC2_9ACTN|nr:alpha/beta hydrolase [Catenulispora pinistramenti]MBS2551350.1 lysophospholipase [Catenulispora pinistramenti]